MRLQNACDALSFVLWLISFGIETTEKWKFCFRFVALHLRFRCSFSVVAASSLFRIICTFFFLFSVASVSFFLLWLHYLLAFRQQIKMNSWNICASFSFTAIVSTDSIVTEMHNKYFVKNKIKKKTTKLFFRKFVVIALVHLIGPSVDEFSNEIQERPLTIWLWLFDFIFDLLCWSEEWNENKVWTVLSVYFIIDFIFSLSLSRFSVVIARNVFTIVEVFVVRRARFCLSILFGLACGSILNKMGFFFGNSCARKTDARNKIKIISHEHARLTTPSLLDFVPFHSFLFSPTPNYFYCDRVLLDIKWK